MSETPPNQPQSELRDLLAQCIEAFAGGGDSAVEQLLAGHPEHRSAVRDRLAKLRQAGLLTHETPAPDQIPERLGDFRLIRHLGSGGMGVVYLAVQESLGREVALKLVRPDQLFFPGARDRFRREVEAIGRLHDPGIVGIHTVGEEAGVPFFAMELVQGATLTDVLQALVERPADQLRGADALAAVRTKVPDAEVPPTPAPLFAGSWVEFCIGVATAVAQALVHAHAQGVLHRDLKPSNVMLTPAGRVVLLDFGLAHARGAARITRSGAQLGSVHYMAPEQVRGEGDAIDERTDVYSLGVLLYELLTLRLPFHGGSSDEVARRILEAAPIAPSRHVPSLGWDVETVCLSAMDPERSRRYPSASALLRDLRNLMERRPIEARRPALSLRLLRFAQRHRTLTTAALLAVLGVIALPAIVAIREAELNRELATTIEARDHEMTRARHNVELASQALNRVLQLVVDEDLDQVPDLRNFGERLLQETAAQLDALLASNPSEPAAVLDLAATLAHAGNLRWRFRDLGRADATLTKALQLLQTAPASLRDSDPVRFQMLRLDIRLSLALLRSPQVPKEVYVAQLQAILDDTAIDLDPALPREFIERWAVGLERLGRELLRTDADAGTRFLQRSLAVWQSLVARHDDAQAWLGQSTLEASWAKALVGNPARVAERQQAADEALSTAARRPLHEEATRRDLANQLERRGSELRLTDPATARTMLQQAIDLYAASSQARPSRVQARLRRLGVERTLSLLELQARERNAAIARRQRVIAECREMLTTWPEQPGAWTILLETQMEVLRMQGLDTLAGQQALAADAAIAERLQPELATLLDVTARAYTCVAELALRRDDVATATQAVARAWDTNRRVERIAKQQGVGVYNDLLLRYLDAELLARRGELDAAVTVLRGAGQQLHRDLRRRLPWVARFADHPGFAALLQELESQR